MQFYVNVSSFLRWQSRLHCTVCFQWVEAGQPPEFWVFCAHFWHQRRRKTKTLKLIPTKWLKIMCVLLWPQHNDEEQHLWSINAVKKKNLKLGAYKVYPARVSVKSSRIIKNHFSKEFPLSNPCLFFQNAWKRFQIFLNENLSWAALLNWND